MIHLVAGTSALVAGIFISGDSTEALQYILDEDNFKNFINEEEKELPSNTTSNDLTNKRRANSDSFSETS